MTSDSTNPVFDKAPRHIAIIMDGNGRWAKERGKPRVAGHRAGTDNLRDIVRACVEFGVKYLTVYAFSTENWSRPKMEVAGLMQIFSEVIDRDLGELSEEGAKLLHIGHLDGLPDILQKKVRHAVEITKDNDRITFVLAFNYGGRDEIVHAVKRMLEDGVDPEEVDEALVNQYMFTAGIPDPDLVIRTSGEQRTSNFLTWQTVYSEWIFPSVYWPDFGKEELRKAIEAYNQRERRFGGLTDS
ncbi:MAG: isoprenyl transferase [Chloroflexota bacterium]|nr:isoprenyl transferase [Chloroflexota bacterium]